MFAGYHRRVPRSVHQLDQLRGVATLLLQKRAVCTHGTDCVMRSVLQVLPRSASVYAAEVGSDGKVYFARPSPGTEETLYRFV